MSDHEIAIAVDQVSKCYRIYDQARDRLLQLLWRGGPDRYREFWALRDLSFSISRGETMGIVGRNGAGKSTLLQLISGTLTPTAGRVKVNGRVAALLELGAGFNPEFTGRENVILNATIFGLSRQTIDARMDDILAFADIGDFVDQPVKTYSSGMYLRLAFAVIAHVDADILVVDEALAVGDAVFTQKCMRFLRKFQDHGTLLFVSHDTAAVAGLCEKAIWLDHGTLRMAGAAKEVIDSYLAFCVEAQQGGSEIPTMEVAPDMLAPVADPLPTERALPAPSASPPGPVEGFAFDPAAAGFGLGGAVIADVELLDIYGRALRVINGGEAVVLRIRCIARIPIMRPIVGFYIKDRLGQFLFGDNSYQTYLGQEISVDAGDAIEARFAFDMPLLPEGDYSICPSIAEGTQEEHVQHHWIHDALIFKSHAHNSIRGLVGIPMKQIEIRTLPQRRPVAATGATATPELVHSISRAQQ